MTRQRAELEAMVETYQRELCWSFMTELRPAQVRLLLNALGAARECLALLEQGPTGRYKRRGRRPRSGRWSSERRIRRAEPGRALQCGHHPFLHDLKHNLLTGEPANEVRLPWL